MADPFADDTFDVPLSQRAAARPAAQTPYLEGLNEAQRDAVESLDGPLLVLAGAGTGKTRVLTTRLAHLLNTGKAQPNEILCVTFTNKAAREMRERIGSMIGGAVEGMPWLGTFHSVSAKMLRRHAELVDLQSNFSILDTDDQIRLLKQLIRAEGIDDKRWPARLLASLIDGWKNRGLSPEKVPAGEAAQFANNQGGALYAEYQARLKTLNAADFGDLMLHTLHILQHHPDILERYHRYFRYLLVDEYQDTNVAQYLWLRLLAQGSKNICCVGDDDQSIYGWRGAEVGNILKFEQDFPGAKTVRLEQNYRSTPHILAAASQVIAGNKDRLGKTLWTDTAEGEKVRLLGVWDGDEEARQIGEELEALQGKLIEQPTIKTQEYIEEQQEADQKFEMELSRLKSTEEWNKLLLEFDGDDTEAEYFLWNDLGYESKLDSFEPKYVKSSLKYYSLNQCAVLVRATHQMRAFEDRFLTIGMPYRVIGGPRFYERAEIRDAIAYIRVVSQPDDSLAFERIVNTPRRGLGDKAVQEISRISRERNCSMTRAALAVVEEEGLSTRARNSLRKLLEDFARWRGILKDTSSDLAPHELVEMVLDESGYTDMWKADKSAEAPGRLENLKELVRSIADFETIGGFLDHVSLVMDNAQDTGGECVSIMTLHAAKGLEFDAVFLPGWEDGLFPSQRAMDEEGRKGLEEERRLAYVGITRARRLSTITFAANRRIYNQWQTAMPSRFIDELPPEHVEVLTPPGLYGGGYGAAAAGSATMGPLKSEVEEKAASANVYNSPGWQRMQKNASRTAKRDPVVIDAKALPNFEVGERVFHQKFGYGTVEALDQDKAIVLFEKAGEKKVVVSYLTRPDDAPF